MTQSEKIILLLIKIFSRLLVLTGIVICLFPLVFVFHPELLGETQPLPYRPDISPVRTQIFLFILYGIVGGYIALTGAGYWRRKIWGPMCGIFLFVLALMLGAKGFNEDLPTLVRAAYLGGGLVFGLFYLLPFFVWKHFYDVNQT
ncbi:MAG: hypothetical protein AB7S78_02835 [Candidatus Omnitrophota bacterium]